MIVYLVVTLMLLQLVMGANLALLMQSLAGGEWGPKFLGALRRLSRKTPVILILFAINFTFLAQIYPWVAHPDLLKGRGQHVLMQPAFFIVRGLVLLSLFFWISLAARDQKASRPKWSIALILLFFGVTVGSFDWVSSLTPEWTSSILGVLFLGGGFVGALSLALLSEPSPEPKPYIKGNLLFVGCCSWAYLVLSQLMVIYMGFEPLKLAYLNVRAEGFYKPVTFTMWGLQFLLPFFVLLFRPLKRRPAILVGLAIGVLMSRYLEIADWTLLTPSQFAIGAAAAVASTFAMWRFG